MLLFTPRHSQSLLTKALPPLRGSPLLCSSLSRPKDTMLIDWRSRPTFMQADFHARQKKAHKNVRVNCNYEITSIAIKKAIRIGTSMEER